MQANLFPPFGLGYVLRPASISGHCIATEANCVAGRSIQTAFRQTGYYNTRGLLATRSRRRLQWQCRVLSLLSYGVSCGMVLGLGEPHSVFEVPVFDLLLRRIRIFPRPLRRISTPGHGCSALRTGLLLWTCQLTKPHRCSRRQASSIDSYTRCLWKRPSIVGDPSVGSGAPQESASYRKMRTTRAGPMYAATGTIR